jgi:hypothetical protein
MWLALGIAALIGIVAGILAAMHAHKVSTRVDRERAAITAYVNQFRLHLPDDRTPIPPDVIVIFPSVRDDIDNFKTLSAAQADQKGKDLTAAATRSATGLQKVAIGRLVPAEFSADRSELNEAQFLIVQAYQLYEPVGGLLQTAGKASGDERQALLDQARALTTQSGGLFDRGYSKIVRIANRLGIPIKTAFQPPARTPTPTPTVSATPSASASPSASPSA